MESTPLDAIIVGAGPAGLVAACLLGKAGIKAALVSPLSDFGTDPRTVALMVPSIRLLERLGLWPGELEANSSALRKLRLVDDTGSMFPAPDLVFSASELGEDAFGWNIPLSKLLPALMEKAKSLNLRIHASEATGMIADESSVTIQTSCREAISASIILAADGYSSALRRCAGIPATEWSYDQAAIALSFSHSEPHRNISTEYHREAGPFTTVPLPGSCSSLVWMERPGRANELMALDDRSLAIEIQLSTHGELGVIDEIGRRKLFPMRGLRAQNFARNRVMLIGEAGHVVPPIGAQGLNLSLRDAAEAADIVITALANGADPGDPRLLSGYDAHRRRDVLPRQWVIDLMNRSLLSGLLPLEAGRAAGLAALNRFPPLRHFVMQRGLGLSSELPSAMR